MNVHRHAATQRSLFPSQTLSVLSVLSVLPALLVSLGLLSALACAGGGGAMLPASESELEGLVNEGMAVARDRLRSGQEIWPFAYTKDKSGRVQRIDARGAETPEDRYGGIVPTQNESAKQALDRLEAQVAASQASDGKYQAVAFFAETFILLKKSGRETDAVEVSVEAADGYCSNLFYPYSRLAQGGLVMGEPLRTTRKDGNVFGGCK